MFSIALLQSTQNSQRPPPEAAFSNPTLPVEIWDYILQLASGNNLARLVSFASVSRLFLDICVRQCANSRIISFLNNIDVTYDNQVLLYKTNGELKKLANDAQGRIYFSCDDGLSLLIFNPEKSGESLKIDIIDALKRKKISDNEDESGQSLWDQVGGENKFARIRECIVHTEVFLIVLRNTITFWEWDEQGVPYLCHYSQLGSGPHISIDYLFGTSDCHYVSRCYSAFKPTNYSINSKDPSQVCIVDMEDHTHNRFFWRTHELGQSLYASIYEDGILSCYSVDFVGDNPSQTCEARYKKMASLPIDGKWMRFSLIRNISLQFAQYILLKTRSNITVFCTNRKQILYFEHMESNWSNFFIVDETLFLFGEKEESPDCKVIYLPTKKDITELFTPYFSPLLSDHFLIWDLRLQRQCQYLFLNIIFEKVEAEPGNFYSLKIADKEIIDQLRSEDNLLPDNSSHKPSIEGVSSAAAPEAGAAQNPHLFTFKANGSFCVPHKLMMFAGIILSFGTAIGTVTLMIFHPGMVIYQGSGVILTLPAVMTLGAGGSVALSILAIGSIRWYQAHKRSDF